jgi:RNA polymerase sigma-70 factor (ECF subfamily)
LQLRELENAITRLQEEQREVILLVGLEGLRYAEAAVILSVPIGRVRSRLSRTRDTLRKLLDRDAAGVVPGVLAERIAVSAEAA